MGEYELPFSPACERNKVPIAGTLADWFRPGWSIVEIGAGTGQHGEYIAAQLMIDWQPTDRIDNLPGIAARVAAANNPRFRPPLELDVLGEWPELTADAAFSANTAHIMPWEAVEGMFAGLGQILPADAPFLLYGPFNEGGEFTSAGNRDLDAWARSIDPRSGIRDKQDVIATARDAGFELAADIGMPANNRILAFQAT